MTAPPLPHFAVAVLRKPRRRPEILKNCDEKEFDWS
jgi:hypothetical protein